MKQQPLTKRQHDVLEFVREFIDDHGYAPSLGEICRAQGLRSLATAWKHVHALREKGRITMRWNHKRTIEIVPPPECCPTCGRKIDNAA